MRAIARKPDMTTVSFETLDGVTSGTTSVPTGGSPEEEVRALKTHLQSNFGWKVEYIVLEMYEPGKYVILFDTISMRFIRACSVVAEATTDADKGTVQTELRAYIKRDQIREFDLDAIFSYYNITTIGEAAFWGCSSLTTISIPDSVTTIGMDAFSSCISLTTISIPDSVTAIGDNAFDGCTSLTTISIPDSVTAIGDNAFDGCTSLTTIAIPDSVTAIGDNAFSCCTSLTTIAIPDSVTTIGDNAFSCCTSLSTIVIPDSVTTIGMDVFSCCTSLSTIAIPDSVTTNSEIVFKGCNSLVRSSRTPPPPIQ